MKYSNRSKGLPVVSSSAERISEGSSKDPNEFLRFQRKNVNCGTMSPDQIPDLHRKEMPSIK